MKKARHRQIRQHIAQEAARLMYEEGVSEYFTAKRMAGRRLYGQSGGKTLRHRPMDLPSNGEIRDALLSLATMMEGDARRDRLFAMRVVALEFMAQLTPFSPRLIGSVSTGHVRRGSDIDLHVFTENIDELEDHIAQEGWDYERREVTIRKGNHFQDYTHFHIEETFAVELSIYEPRDMRVVQLSSTDGKPIVRVKPNALRELIADQHPGEWAVYLQTQELPSLHRFAGEEVRPTLAEIEAMSTEDT